MMEHVCRQPNQITEEEGGGLLFFRLAGVFKRHLENIIIREISC